MKSLCRTIVPLFLAVLLVSTVFAIVITDRPSANYASGMMVVSWRTIDETGVRNFEVFRAEQKEGKPGEFISQGSVDATGKPSPYSFTDMHVFRTNAGLFVYKVRVWFQNGSYSDSEPSYPEAALSSTAKRTWGSIKAMFR